MNERARASIPSCSPSPSLSPDISVKFVRGAFRSFGFLSILLACKCKTLQVIFFKRADVYFFEIDGAKLFILTLFFFTIAGIIAVIV